VYVAFVMYGMGLLRDTWSRPRTVFSEAHGHRHGLFAYEVMQPWNHAGRKYPKHCTTREAAERLSIFFVALTTIQ
jgi:hypothetical protein